MNKTERSIKIGIGLILMGFITYWLYQDVTATCGTLFTPSCSNASGWLASFVGQLAGPTLFTLLSVSLLVPFDKRSVAHYRWVWLIVIAVCAGALPFVGLMAIVALLWNPTGTYDRASWTILGSFILAVIGLIIGLARLHKPLLGGNAHA